MEEVAKPFGAAMGRLDESRLAIYYDGTSAGRILG